MENEKNDGQQEIKPEDKSKTYVIGGNLVLLILYTICVKTSNSGSDSIILLAFLIAFQIIVNIVLKRW